MREHFNTKEGYIEIMTKYLDFIDRDYKDLNSYDLAKDKEKIEATYSSLYKYSSGVINAKYSLNENYDSIYSLYKNQIVNISFFWKKTSGYVQMLETLSIGIMLDVSNDDFNKLAQCVKNDNPNDFLIDFLINYKDKSWKKLSSTFMWNKPYENTKTIVEIANNDKQKSLEALKKYLIQWYKSIETKTHNSKWNIHTGYWCWEAGALVKILGLDDSGLKDQQYYPYDMVHWKD